MEGFKACSRCCSFVVVNKIPLSKAFDNIANFVASDIAQVITFLFADKLTFERALPTRYVRARNQNKDIEISQAFQFIASTSNPVFSCRGGHSRRPRGIIIVVREHSLSRTSRNSSKNVVDRVICGDVKHKGNEAVGIANGGKLG